jgi:hypothetical protein
MKFTEDVIKSCRICAVFLDEPAFSVFNLALDEIECLQAENGKQKIAIANQGKIINKYQKQSTDLQYELDTIKNNPEAEKYYFEKWTELKQRIAELEQERRWIPVSERLPEEEGEYWVCYFYDNKTIQGYCDYKLKDGFENALAWDNTEIVTHWQPRPQPPKGGE